MKGKSVELVFSVLIAALLLAKLNAEEETDDDFIHVTDTISTGRKFESTVFPESTQVQCVSYVALTTRRDPVPVRAFLIDAVTGEDLFAADSHRDSITDTPTLFHFDLQPHTDPYQLVIEVDDGDTGLSALVTVYDLEISKGKCKDSDSSCDFEASTCQFTNNDVYKSSWERYRPLDDDEAGTYTPIVDADVGAVSGSYMRARVNESSGAAELSTHVNLEEAGATCIQFYFSIYGKGSLQIRKEGTKAPVKILTNIEPSQKNINLKWKDAHVEIAAQESYVLSFLANPHQSGGDSWMAIDDVKIKRHGCFETDQPIKPSSPPVNAESSCDFEGPCADKWISSTSANGNKWTIRTGKDTNNEPHYDNTKGDPTGKFMFVWFPQRKGKEISVLRGPDFDRSRHDGVENCFSFWYYLHGPVVPRLSVYFRWSGNNSDAIWMTEHSHWPAWQQAFVHIPDPGDELGHIEFEMTKKGSAAVDDIVVYDGACPGSADLCDFENGDICGYKKARGSWIKRRATYIESVTGLSADRSTRTKWGFYIYVNTQNSNVQKSPELVSPVFPATSGRCLQFFYHVKNPMQGTAALDVYLRDEEKHSYLLGRFSGMDGQSWLMAQAMLISSTPYQIVFDAQYKTSIVSLDDIKITNTMCAKAYDCDFEYGLCSWRTDLDDAGNLDWQVKSGYLPEGERGPHKDVTLNTQYGRYILLQAVDPAKPGDTAVLTSQEINMGSCLIFYYSMMADGTGSLSVNLTTPGEDSVPQTLWSRSGGQGDFPVWRQARVDIPVKRTLKDSLKDFQLHLIGTVGTGTGADIAVDEISIHYNLCSDVLEDDDFTIECKNSSLGQTITRTQVCNFIPECPGGEDEEVCGNCDFSETEGFCQYVDVSFGEVLWEHSTAQPPELLEGIPRRPRDSPAKRKGDFLFVSHLFDEERGQMIARLETDFTFGPSPPTCQLRFSYFVSSTSSPALQVIIHQSAEETVIFSANSYMVSWATVTLNIGSIDAKFKIAFLGQKEFGKVNEGDVAIDDIQMINCEFPPIVDTCKPTESRCKRGSCVDVSRICDFNDDCGDQSDEEDCDSKLYILRTNFEEGFGEWTIQDDALTTKWLIQDGRAGQTNDSEPGRDHTVGNLNGHYMIKTRSNKLPSRIISPVLMAPSSSTTCHLRLYYYIVGTHNLIQLRVYTRTEQPGDEKLIFDRFTSHGQAWTRADIEIEDTEHAFQIIIEGTDGHSDSVLALDDISLYGCMINFNQTLPEGTPKPTPAPCPASKHRCQDGTCLGRSEVHECDFIEDCPDGSDEQNCGTCDFETNMCGWHDESLGIYSWVYRASSQQPQPSSDSTKDTEGKGHFMLLQTHSAGIAKDPALLLSPEFSETGPQCTFSFSYYTNVDHVEDALIIQTQTYDDAGTENAVNLPKVSGTPASIGEWTRVRVNIGKSATPMHVVIKHRFHAFSDFVAIAIDDTKFENCGTYSGMRSIAKSTAPLECNFEDESLCYFHLSYPSSDFPWKPIEVRGPTDEFIPAVMAGSMDGSEIGHTTAMMTTDWINGTATDVCLEFTYMTFGTTLYVYVLSPSARRLAFVHHSFEYLWQTGHASIPANNDPFLVEFIAVLGQHAEVLYLANIKASKNRCPRSAVCSFEEDDCDYKSDTGRSWARINRIARDYRGPKIDHTTGESHGYFIMATAKSAYGQKKISLVRPPVTQQSDQDSCTFFWYHLPEDDASTLSVKYRTTGAFTDTQLWSSNGKTGNHWLQGRVSIPKDAGEYSLIFEAQISNDDVSYVALDDIETREGPCSHSGSCDFDSDMCGYTSHTFSVSNDIETESRWLRLRNGHPLSRYGPPQDHTQRNEFGGYAFSTQFVVDFMDSNILAKLTSPFLPSTEQSCLSFWYFFKGQGEGTLFVLNGDSVWFEEKEKSDQWRYATVEISSDTPFQIDFGSKRTSHAEASMAVDDIVVREGSCRTDAPSSKIADTLTTQPTSKPTIKSPDVLTTKPSSKTPAKKPSEPATEPPAQPPVRTTTSLPIEPPNIPPFEPPVPTTDPYPTYDMDKYRIDCNEHCMHWRNCRGTDTGVVKCICQEGYEGDRCDEKKKKDMKGTLDNDGSADTDQRKSNTEEGGGNGNGWLTPVAVVGAIVLVVVLGFVVFVVLVRTNKIQAPAPLQRLMPSLLSSQPYDGMSSPIANSSDNDEGNIFNPVYGEM